MDAEAFAATPRTPGRRALATHDIPDHALRRTGHPRVCPHPHVRLFAGRHNATRRRSHSFRERGRPERCSSRACCLPLRDRGVPGHRATGWKGRWTLSRRWNVQSLTPGAARSPASEASSRRSDVAQAIHRGEERPAAAADSVPPRRGDPKRSQRACCGPHGSARAEPRPTPRLAAPT